MRKLITEVPEESGSTYQLYADLTDIPTPAGYKHLSFSSVWTGAKDPKLEQNKFKMTLSPESLANLKDLLNANE